MKDILYNYEWMCVIMAVFIFLFTFVLKYPIKLATKRIKDERKRKMANATILLIPFMLGILCEYAYTHWLLDVVIPFSLVSADEIVCICQRIFCLNCAVYKSGNTYSIPPLSKLSLEPKPLADCSCRFDHRLLYW